jgi:hypothetical protein
MKVGELTLFAQAYQGRTAATGECTAPVSLDVLFNYHAPASRIPTDCPKVIRNFERTLVFGYI